MLIYVFSNRKIVVTVTSTGNTGEAYELSDDPNDDTVANMGAMELLGKNKGGFLPKLFKTQISQTNQKAPSGQGDDASRRQNKIGTDKDTQAGSDRDSNSESQQIDNKHLPSQATDTDQSDITSNDAQFPLSSEQFIDVVFPEPFKKLFPEQLTGVKEWSEVGKEEAPSHPAPLQLTREQLEGAMERLEKLPEQFRALFSKCKEWGKFAEAEVRKWVKKHKETGGIETVAEPKSAPPQPEPSSTGAWPAILPLALLAAAALLYALWRSKSQAARAKTIHGSGSTAGYPRPIGGVDSSKLKPKKRTATTGAPTRPGEVAPVTGREQRVDESPKKDTSFQTHRMRETIQACDEENLRLLLEDRLDEVDDDKADLEKQARDVALLLDEIHGLETPYAGKPDGVVLARLADDLKAELRARDCELLDSDVWNPDIQRAVRVEPTDEPLEHPIILAKQSLGVKVRGRLVRKQEVKIKKHIPS